MRKKRLFDIVLSVFLIFLSLPLWVFISIAIRLDSKGSIVYKSRRIGRYEREFILYKFRTMRPNHDPTGITIGERDPRITRVGVVLRKLKLDELPQLLNLMRGEMSLVGPRPDVPGYNKVYKQHNPHHFDMKPGLTSPSSIYFMRESEIYPGLEDPRQQYVDRVIPRKVELDREIINNGIRDDMQIILRTFRKLIKSDKNE